MKRLLIPIVTCLLVFALPGMAQPQPHRVIIALTSPDATDWKLTIGNIHHLLEDFKAEPSQLEIVAYGPGIDFLRKTSSAAQEIAALEKQHVSFVACENSMKHMQITVGDLVLGVTTVPSGIGEVVRKQEQGWAYIKAGR